MPEQIRSLSSSLPRSPDFSLQRDNFVDAGKRDMEVSDVSSGFSVVATEMTIPFAAIFPYRPRPHRDDWRKMRIIGFIQMQKSEMPTCHGFGQLKINSLFCPRLIHRFQDASEKADRSLTACEAWNIISDCRATAPAHRGNIHTNTLCSALQFKH